MINAGRRATTLLLLTLLHCFVFVVVVIVFLESLSPDAPLCLVIYCLFQICFLSLGTIDFFFKFPPLVCLFQPQLLLLTGGSLVFVAVK